MAVMFGNCNLTLVPSYWSKPSVSTYGFPIYGNATLGTRLSGVLLKRSLGFDERWNKCRVTVSDVANEEVKVGSGGISSIEKELNFSPTFSDYVKFMESVKLDRSNIVEESFDDDGLKKNEKLTSLKKPPLKTNDNNYREKSRPTAVKGKNGAWAQVESIMLNKSSKMRDINQTDKSESNLNEQYSRRTDSFSKIGGTIGESVRNKNTKEKLAAPKVYGGGQQARSYQEKGPKFGNFALREKSVEKYGRAVKREHSTVFDGKDRSGIEPLGSQKHKLEEKNEICQLRQRSYQNTGAKFERSGAVEMQEKVKQNRGVDIKREGSNRDIDERAAFKTFEVFTDINNRPRVLRMELEEKIKKLASRLNASDLNMPEWKFSKLMHSAKIRFSDHTILRVVQILGDYGNWKRALHVVQWLKSRERFKSLKTRYIYTTVLDVLGKAKKPFEALNVFHSMREELASYPDLAAYHCIAVTLGQAGLMKELFDVIDCMRNLPEKKLNLGPLQKWDPRLEPDLVVYNAVTLSLRNVEILAQHLTKLMEK